MSRARTTAPPSGSRESRGAAATAAALAIVLVATAAPAPARAGKPTPQSSGVVIHKVERGDTLELLGAEYYGDRRHEIYIMIENGMKHDRPLRPGEKLRIPVSNEVTVAVGDSLASLADHYLGDKRRAVYLAEFNGLGPDSSIAAGMSITVPLHVTFHADNHTTLKDVAKALFADDKKAALLKSYNFLEKDTLEKGDSIIVPIYLRVQPSKRRPPDAQSQALIAKRTQALDEARRALPGARASWKAGDYAAVKRQLAELVMSFPYLDADLVVEIGMLLGSAYVAFGDTDTARATFEQVLARSPRTVMDAYHHSPKVRAVWRKAGGQVNESGQP